MYDEQCNKKWFMRSRGSRIIHRTDVQLIHWDLEIRKGKSRSGTTGSRSVGGNKFMSDNQIVPILVKRHLRIPRWFLRPATWIDALSSAGLSIECWQSWVVLFCPGSNVPSWHVGLLSSRRKCASPFDAVMSCGAWLVVGPLCRSEHDAKNASGREGRIGFAS